MKLDPQALWVVAWPYAATVLGFVMALVLFSYVLRQHERQSASIAWFLAIVLAPLVAVPAYLVFAGRKLAARARRKTPLRGVGAHVDAGLQGNAAVIERLVCGYGLPAATRGNSTQLLTDGDSAYQALMELIDGASSSIQIATFILAQDAVGRAIVERLRERADEGVQVQLLVDAVGSLRSRFGLLRRLAGSRVQVGVFMPMLSLHRKSKANLRNHRKLAIADGCVALTGGMNLGAQYMGPATGGPVDERVRWVDTLVRVEGPAVEDMKAVFDADWSFAVGGTVAGTPLCSPPEPCGEQLLQVVPSGPDVEHDALYDAIVAAVYKAQGRVWVVTPYFVPDEGLMRALVMQARMGSDVRIIRPARSDHWVADMASARYLRTLLAAGAGIYQHPHRMIHAKHLLVDDTLAVAGSVNLDMRSLYLNYELALFGYDGACVRSTEAWMEALLADCRRAELRTPPVWQRLGEDLCWLAAPLL